MMEHIKLTADINCFDLCDILRVHLTSYVESINIHIMKDSSGTMIGCICK
jgi:hypothetical protein